ncbi:MAG: CBS domain-containing protein [Patescibacteria group bacterium]|nr:CBS domain-containing protein [Patescibacteria group bacterium]
MLYFSEIQGKKVLTETGSEVGVLKDLIFLASENPLITKIVIQGKDRQSQVINSDSLLRFDAEVILREDFSSSSLEENELFLVKNLLDKQIIDIKGNKIIRVNDVILVKNKNRWWIAGVDVSLAGLMRRVRFLPIEKIYFFLKRFINIKIRSKFLSWADIHPLDLTRGEVRLRKKEEKLKRIPPEDLADYLERTNILNVKKILGILDLKTAAEVVSNLNINCQTDLFKNFKPETAAKFLRYIDPDEAVDVLLTLPKKRRQTIIDLLDKKTKKSILKLIEWSKNPIGSLMTTEFVLVTSDYTVREVLEKIKKETRDFSVLDYIYVVNKRNELVGVFNLHELLLQDPETTVYRFMVQNVIVIHLTTPEEIAIKKMLKYKLYALPVIDEKKRILGIITFDDLSLKLLEKL